MAHRKAEQPSLMEAAARRGKLAAPPPPLADRMRPRTLEELVGQHQLLAEGRHLREVIVADRLLSLIFWGPPGCGKTSLAAVISRSTKLEFVSFSAVLSGVAELRKAVAEARERRRYQGRGTLLFVDEIHRFNRSQQDAFLPHVEDGTIALIGATTENPSFYINSALLSRCKVFHLEPIDEASLIALCKRAYADGERGLGRDEPPHEQALALIAKSARGDARRALNLLEAATQLIAPGQALTSEDVERAEDEATLSYDKSGEEHYNTISAFIKSMRGSDPDAAIYWLMRLLEAGEDPLFASRRMLIFASEDVGNADPRALAVAVNADAALRRVGMPEGIFPLSHACLYLASCPKSNSVLKALTAARSAVAEHGSLSVPKKLRNAVTKLMKDEGYGQAYQYPHDHTESYVPGETYLPEALTGQRFYEPTESGLEQAIRDRLERLGRPKP